MPGVDPLGSLRSWELIVELGGREYMVPAASAAEWLAVLLEDPFDLSSILPGMLAEDDQSALADAAWAGRVGDKELEDAALEIISEVTGRDWWWAMHLLWVAAGSWMIVYGRMVTQGINPTAIPIGAFLDALYLTCTQGMDKEQRSAFDRDLEKPPPGVSPEEAIDEEAEAASFLGMLNQGM